MGCSKKWRNDSFQLQLGKLFYYIHVGGVLFEKMVAHEDQTVFICYFLSGLGEISESLLSDQNLTPADFLDEPLETLKSSQEDCDVYCASPSPVKCNEFKTPLTSRYSNKASVTPSLFSQDESVHLTPVLSECLVQIFLCTM